MRSARQSPTACWTCKVRRKKCDLNLPTCQGCTSLEIDCHYNYAKPAWMDNGTKQQQMADRLKAEVKRNLSRRNRQNKILQLSSELRSSSARALPSPSSLRSNVPDVDRNTDTSWPSCPTLQSPRSLEGSPRDVNSTLSESSQQAVYNQPQAGAIAAHERSDFESSLLMSYLDYAFPLLFPFYHPTVREAGRVWLLTLALKCPAFYHNIIGMAAFFSSAVPVSSSPESNTCLEMGQEELRIHMQKAVRGVQDSLRGVNQMGLHHSVPDNIRLLGNIVQLVNCEVVFASSANWQMHLDAAISLFEQTLRHFGGTSHVATSMRGLLEALGGDITSGCSFLSAEQAALRFFAALIVHQDVISSTVREETPKLLGLYDGLLARSATSDTSSWLLNLDNFTGCPNWIVRAIASISSLNDWKKDAKRAGNLDILDLVSRATVIQQELRDGNARLDELVMQTVSPTQTGSWQALESILARSNIIKPPTSTEPAIHCTVNKIWAHAAEVYLITVLSGWQPGNLQLRNHVAQALKLFETIDNPSWLRTLAWPFCIIGCFATEKQEPAFLGVAQASGGLAMFGTLRDALAIMQKVWSSRNQYNADVWDVAYCLRILGHSVLLV